MKPWITPERSWWLPNPTFTSLHVPRLPPEVCTGRARGCIHDRCIAAMVCVCVYACVHVWCVSSPGTRTVPGLMGQSPAPSPGATSDFAVPAPAPGRYAASIWRQRYKWPQVWASFHPHHKGFLLPFLDFPVLLRLPALYLASTTTSTPDFPSTKQNDINARH